MDVEAICVGHACYDLCMFVDGYPAENSKAETDALIESGGGPAANAAYLLSRWGVATAFAGAVGDDPYGQRVVAEFRQAGTDLGLLQIRPGQRTPVSFIIVNRANGSRTIINRKPPGQPARLPVAAGSGYRPRLLLFDGHELDAALELLDAFPAAMTVLDAGSLRKGTEVLAARVGYLVCSERFARQVTGLRQLDDAAARGECLQRLRHSGAQTVVVTLGERGLIFAAAGTSGHVPACRVRAVDTTAAGDIFHGAFAYGLLQGLPLPQVLRLATVAAGLSVQVAGGRPALPDRAAVLEALAHD